MAKPAMIHPPLIPSYRKLSTDSPPENPVGGSISGAGMPQFLPLDEEYRKLVFTHPSIYANIPEVRLSEQDSGEDRQPMSSLDNARLRLSWLGDSLLEVCVSEYLYEKYPDWTIGDLTVECLAICRISIICQ